MKQTITNKRAIRLMQKHGLDIAWQRALARAVEQADLTGIAEWARVVEVLDQLVADNIAHGSRNHDC